MNKIQHVHIRISGLVQGVWFRAFVRKEATLLKLTGAVWNNPDGSVEVMAEGKTKSLESLISSCRKGPPHARVDSVFVTRGNVTGTYTSFCILDS